MKISIEVVVNVARSQAWERWVTPEDIIQWNFATDEWCCPKAEIALKNEGKFSYRMEAKDGSMGFDFAGVFIKIVPEELIEFKMDDNRTVVVEFSDYEGGTKVAETFEAEDENSAEMQRQGWQAILNNFKKHAEGLGS